MYPEENQRHPLKPLSMGVSLVVLPIAIWHGLCSLFVIMMADYTKNPLFLLLLVSAVTPFIILVRRMRGVEWSTRDVVFTALAVVPGIGLTLWVGLLSKLLSSEAVIASLVAYVIALAGSIRLARHRAFH